MGENLFNLTLLLLFLSWPKYNQMYPEIHSQIPIAQLTQEVPNLQTTLSYLKPSEQLNVNNLFLEAWNNAKQTSNTLLPQTSTTNLLIASSAISTAGQFGTNYLSNKLFDLSTDWGRTLGTVFSQGSSAAMGTLSSNMMKGAVLTEGLGLNVGVSLGGAGAGLAGNYIGQGIASAGGNSMLSRGIGAGVGTYIGTKGGSAISNLLGKASYVNPYGLAMSVVGNGLSAAFGPSKEYSGKYGSVTRTADTVYDVIQTGVNAIPVYGQIVSGAMALNKGLSNIFGSTDAMTKQDAILGSAFMGAPVKWLNMWGSSKTSNFNGLNLFDILKVNSFMGNAFGDLYDKFDRARAEANKTYGTFSQGAKRDAQRNIDFANYAWTKVNAMADLNELQNIRSLYMSAINNQRYAQDIQGPWQPIYRGKSGMKIFNNATNHNIGMRLLSAAALIDNKQMILSAQTGTKLEFKSELDWSPESWFSKRVKKPDGTLYNELEAKILASHVPEYHNIEQTSKANGTWLKMPDGSTWDGDPRSWVMMLSEAYKNNYSEKPWYTGQALWLTKFNYGSGEINTDKVTRAPYYNGLMWFSNSKSYGDVFAHVIDSLGGGERYLKDSEKNIKGKNFLAAIPKIGNFRFLEAPPQGTYDHWSGLPYRRTSTSIERVKKNSEEFADRGNQNLYFPKAREEDWETTYKTDDIVNWSKDLGDLGIFMNKIYDGPNKISKDSEGNYHMYGDPSLENSIDEFISQPGFTNKVKFIEGNTGDFDIKNPYKYANVFKKINLNLV